MEIICNCIPFHRPQELTSKKPVSVFRNLFQVKKKEEPIDPRFNSAFGEYKPEFFRKRYSFINDLRIKEKEVFCLFACEVLE